MGWGSKDNVTNDNNDNKGWKDQSAKNKTTGGVGGGVNSSMKWITPLLVFICLAFAIICW